MYLHAYMHAFIHTYIHTYSAYHIVSSSNDIVTFLSKHLTYDTFLKEFQLTLTSSSVHFDVGHLEECSLDLLQRSKFMQKQSVKHTPLYIISLQYIHTRIVFLLAMIICF